jgi:hypothetical protein
MLTLSTPISTLATSEASRQPLLGDIMELQWVPDITELEWVPDIMELEWVPDAMELEWVPDIRELEWVHTTPDVKSADAR